MPRVVGGALSLVVYLVPDHSVCGPRGDRCSNSERQFSLPRNLQESQDLGREGEGCRLIILTIVKMTNVGSDTKHKRDDVVT